MNLPRIETDERRARLGARHLLSRPSGDVESVAATLVGMHSSDPASVFLSARARTQDFDPADLEHALYESRTLVRVLGMRLTMFVVPRDLASIVDSACTRALAPAQHRRLARMLEDQGITQDGAEWLERVCDETAAVLGKRGEASAVELTADVPDLGLKLTFGEGRKWRQEVGVSTRVLFLMAAQGRVVRARPKGGWTSSQYRWALTDAWLDGVPARPDPEAASADLLTRWLASYGPGTLTDIKWWTGWTVAKVRATLGAIDAAEVGLGGDGGSAFVLADDLGSVDDPASWVALLPSLDATVMGWKERDWYLGGHANLLFDRNGNSGPTVWVDGRVVGGWSQRTDGEVAVRLLERVDSATEDMIGEEARSLAEWLGDVRVKPRFRTPLERELSG